MIPRLKLPSAEPHPLCSVRLYTVVGLASTLIIHVRAPEASTHAILTSGLTTGLLMSFLHDSSRVKDQGLLRF